MPPRAQTSNPSATRYRHTWDAQPAARALALLDVVIGMAIFALIAAIAVVIVGNFQHRAHVTGVISDARSIGLGIEATATQTGAVPEQVSAPGTGDRAIVAVVPSAKVSTTPQTVEKKIGVITRGNRIGGYARLSADGAKAPGFLLCVEHVENGAVSVATAPADAHAVWDSVKGGVIVSGNGGCAAAMADLTDDTTDPGDDPDDDPGNTGGPGPGDPGGLPAPDPVKVTTVDGEAHATVTWEAVPGATGYDVYLDKSTDPTWSGPEVTTKLTGLPGGTHEVVVIAHDKNTDGTPSKPAEFEIYEDNDYIRWAHPVGDTGAGKPWYTRNYTNVAATIEPGEPSSSEAASSNRGMWWKLTATRDATYTLDVSAPTDGSGLYTYPQVTVWNANTRTVADLGTPVVSSQNQTKSRQVFYATKGQTYMIRVSSMSKNWTSKYRLSVARGPANDMLADADTIPAISDSTWRSDDTSNVYAGPEAGETSESPGSMWWTFTATRTTTYKLSVIADSAGSPLYTHPQIAVWDSASTSPADLPLTGALVDNYLSPNVSFPVTRGHTYKVRVSTSNSYSANYRTPFRVQVVAGPTNDYIGDATSIPLDRNATGWTGGDVDNTLAGPEVGEPDGGHGSMWWTVTAPRTTTMRIDVLNPSDGSPLFNYPKIRVWKTTASSVTSLGTIFATNSGGGGLSPWVAFPVVEGETFKVRVSTENSNTASYRSQYRVRVSLGPENDSLVAATNIPLASGGSWTSPDVDNTLAGPQTGEPDGGHGGMWWTFTPAIDGTMGVVVVAPTDGSRLFTYPKIRVFRSSSLSVSELGAEHAANREWGGLNPYTNFAVTAGQTYKIRVSSEDTQSPNYRSKYRLRAHVAAPGQGGPWGG